MNKSPKVAFLALALLATINHITQCYSPDNPPSTLQVIFTFFFGQSQPQPQNNPDQAPAGVTTQDYLTQFRYDLNGTTDTRKEAIIPWHEVQKMEEAIKKELGLIDLRDRNKVNEAIRSVLLNQVKTETIADIRKAEAKGYVTTPEDYQVIPNTHEYDMIARLGRAPHLNGESIAQYFGEARKQATRKALRERHSNYNPFL
jgi:hypothetical protein